MISDANSRFSASGNFSNEPSLRVRLTYQSAGQYIRRKTAGVASYFNFLVEPSRWRSFYPTAG